MSQQNGLWLIVFFASKILKIPLLSNTNGSLMRGQHKERIEAGHPVPTCVCGGVVFTPTNNSLDFSWVSYSSPQFSHCLPGDSIRFHRLSVQSHKTDPLFRYQCQVQVVTPVLRPAGYKLHPLLGFDQFARAAHRTQQTGLLTRLLVYYKEY